MSDHSMNPFPINNALAGLFKQEEQSANSAFSLASLLDKRPYELSPETLAVLLAPPPHSAAAAGLKALNNDISDGLFSLGRALLAPTNPISAPPVSFLRMARDGLTNSPSIKVKGMALEERLRGWTGPSSDTEQDKQERSERMIRKAIADHPPFRGCNLSVYAKGSYANNTNVRADNRFVAAY